MGVVFLFSLKLTGHLFFHHDSRSLVLLLDDIIQVALITTRRSWIKLDHTFAQYGLPLSIYIYKDRTSSTKSEPTRG